MKRTKILEEIKKYAEENINTIPAENKVPVSGAVISSDDIVSIIDTVLDGWFTQERVSARFADSLKEYICTKFCTLCNSGSSANLLAITALTDGMEKGKKIITCATSFPTTVAPIIQNGFIPLFVDIDPYTLVPCTDRVLALLEDKDVVGVILTHILGFAFDAEAVANKCKEEGKFFVEDCADALGTKLFGEHVGTYGDMGTFSFFPAHHITSMEGGAVITNGFENWKLLKKYLNWGRDCWCLPGQSNVCGKRFERKWKNLPEGYDHKYTFSKVGYNLKITEVQSALGLSQMQRVEKFTKQRQDNYKYLEEKLAKFDDCIFPIKILHGSEPSPFGFPILTENKNEMVRFLENSGISTRPVFAGNITNQPMMESVFYEVDTSLTGSNWVMKNIFWVGCWHGLSEPHLNFIVDTIEEYFKVNKCIE